MFNVGYADLGCMFLKIKLKGGNIIIQRKKIEPWDILGDLAQLKPHLTKGDVYISQVKLLDYFHLKNLLNVALISLKYLVWELVKLIFRFVQKGHINKIILSYVLHIFIMRGKP
jgi:hypothetical protein